MVYFLSHLKTDNEISHHLLREHGFKKFISFEKHLIWKKEMNNA